MTVSLSIMAHRDRESMVTSLQASLSGDIPVAWDRGIDRWDTGVRAWQHFDPKATWHVVIQDDAVLATGFEQQIADFLCTQLPDHPVSFYLGAGRPRQHAVARQIRVADSINSPQIVLPWLLWGVCFALPTAHIPKVLEECSSGIPHYDSRISRYFERRKINTVYSWPSLADHRDEPSLVYENPSMKRVAHRFAG